MDTRQRFSPITIALHWLVALGILGLIGLGIYMARTEAWPLYHLHKSIGLLLFLVILVRLVWRLRQGFPEPAGTLNRFEHLAALWMHRALLACTVLMPLAGMLYSGASGNGFGIFSVEIFPANPLRDASGMAVPFNASLAALGQTLHAALGYTLLALIALHLGAALKHHLLDRDRTLLRMLGR